MILQINGSLTVAPQTSTGTEFPSGVSAAAFIGTPNPKNSQACTGIQQRTVNSSNAFVALSGIGPTDSVTKPDTFYLRTSAPFKVRITENDPAGGPDIVSVQNLQGVMMKELPAQGYMKLVEVMGAGPIEYLASGQS